MAKIVHITAVTGNYPNGQKIDSAIVEYDCALQENIAAHSFSVENRSITGIEVKGNTVCLQLDIQDELASVLQEPKMPPPKPGEKPAGGPPMNLPPAVRRPVQVAVTQLLSISGADGREIPADGHKCVSDKACESVVEDFSQGIFQGIPYNLYTPGNLESGKKYPLVLFIHDAGPCGPDVKLTLSQGLGAVGFAAPAWQEKHPCFVLAPQINRGIHMTTDEFTCSGELESIKSMVDFIVESNPVDTDRIYTTGQSMGCMASCELNIRYPGFFAASLLVAGQWSPERMAEKCSGNKLWILVSEHDRKAFPGMNAVTEALEQKGAVVARYHWNGAAEPEVLTQLARAAMEDNANVRYTVFDGSSVVPEGEPDHPGSNHVNTWRVAYTIEGLREWLFSCRK